MYHTHVDELTQLPAGLFGAFIVLPKGTTQRDTTERLLFLTDDGLERGSETGSARAASRFDDDRFSCRHDTPRAHHQHRHRSDVSRAIAERLDAGHVASGREGWCGSSGDPGCESARGRRDGSGRDNRRRGFSESGRAADVGAEEGRGDHYSRCGCRAVGRSGYHGIRIDGLVPSNLGAPSRNAYSVALTENELWYEPTKTRSP